MPKRTKGEDMKGRSWVDKNDRQTTEVMQSTLWSPNNHQTHHTVRPDGGVVFQFPLDHPLREYIQLFKSSRGIAKRIKATSNSCLRSQQLTGPPSIPGKTQTADTLAVFVQEWNRIEFNFWHVHFKCHNNLAVGGLWSMTVVSEFGYFLPVALVIIAAATS